MLAVAAGAVAATGAGMLLDVMDSPDAEYIITSDNEGPEEMTYDLEAFDEINSVGPQDIVITQGEEHVVRGG